jgi:ubiquitin carboxyl-terminal hydrolase 14
LQFVDAEECWGKITDALKDVPLESGSATSSKKFVEAYMMGQMRRECVYSRLPLIRIEISTNILLMNRLKCDEAVDEPASVSTQNVLKIECNIGSSTNYMHTGIMGVSTLHDDKVLMIKINTSSHRLLTKK